MRLSIHNYGPIANPNNAYIEDFIYVHVGDSVVRDIFAGTGMNHQTVVDEIKASLKPLFIQYEEGGYN
ncbi:MAG: hypothetical protein MZV63_40820 [Marinilabiliales bacterium]|nr:hypothetical protein [Marinilabiliales bacterium]